MLDSNIHNIKSIPWGETFSYNSEDLLKNIKNFMVALYLNQQFIMLIL